MKKDKVGFYASIGNNSGRAGPVFFYDGKKLEFYCEEEDGWIRSESKSPSELREKLSFWLIEYIGE